MAPRGEAFQVIDSNGNVLLDNAVAADVALVRAQSLLAAALGKTREKELHYIVRLKPLFGPPDNLYDVWLTREGAILTAPAGAVVDRAR